MGNSNGGNSHSGGNASGNETKAVDDIDFLPQPEELSHLSKKEILRIYSLSRELVSNIANHRDENPKVKIPEDQGRKMSEERDAGAGISGSAQYVPQFQSSQNIRQYLNQTHLPPKPPLKRGGSLTMEPAPVNGRLNIRGGRKYSGSKSEEKRDMVSPAMSPFHFVTTNSNPSSLPKNTQYLHPLTSFSSPSAPSPTPLSYVSLPTPLTTADCVPLISAAPVQYNSLSAPSPSPSPSPAVPHSNLLDELASVRAVLASLEAKVKIHEKEERRREGGKREGRKGCTRLTPF
jgi:hypothetical protein